MIAPQAVTPNVSALAIGAAVVLATLAMTALAIMGGVGVVGAAIASYAFPIAFLAPTPRNWWFLSCLSAALAAAPAISFSVQVLRPSMVRGQEWRDGAWVPITPPEPLEAITTSAVIWTGLFIVIFAALAVLKRVGVAAKDRL